MQPEGEEKKSEATGGEEKKEAMQPGGSWANRKDMVHHARFFTIHP